MIKFHLRREDIFNHKIKIWVTDRSRTWSDEPYRVAVAHPMVFTAATKEEQINQDLGPALIIEPDEAQQLMDSLWDMGIRPSEGSGSAGQLAATQRHLEDMRTLVLKKQEAKDQ
jgi:hypothetical protein